MGELEPNCYLPGLGDHGLGHDVVDDDVGHGLAARHQLVELGATVATRHDLVPSCSRREKREKRQDFSISLSVMHIPDALLRVEK